MKLFEKPCDIPWGLFWKNQACRILSHGVGVALGKEHESRKRPRMHLAYRISESGYAKVKLPNVNNSSCFRNALTTFPLDRVDWKIICDGCGKETLDMIRRALPEKCIELVQIGNGAGTFNLALDWALGLNDSDVVYFLENDYLHTMDALDVLFDGFSMGAEVITLYDHPDKYDPSHPLFSYMDSHTRVFLGSTRHWKTAFSTTMTFAANVGFLRKYERIFRRWTSGRHPRDFAIFNELMEKGVCVISPMPATSTHGETAFLAPLVDWSRM